MAKCIAEGLMKDSAGRQLVMDDGRPAVTGGQTVYVGTADLNGLVE